MRGRWPGQDLPYCSLVTTVISIKVTKPGDSASTYGCGTSSATGTCMPFSRHRKQQEYLEYHGILTMKYNSIQFKFLMSYSSWRDLKVCSQALEEIETACIICVTHSVSLDSALYASMLTSLNRADRYERQQKMSIPGFLSLARKCKRQTLHSKVMKQWPNLPALARHSSATISQLAQTLLQFNETTIRSTANDNVNPFAYGCPDFAALLAAARAGARMSWHSPAQLRPPSPPSPPPQGRFSAWAVQPPQRCRKLRTMTHDQSLTAPHEVRGCLIDSNLQCCSSSMCSCKRELA